MNTRVNTVPTFATYQAAAISMRMTRLAPSMTMPSIERSANYNRRMSNAQLFADVAREYANFRPGYPPELFAWLADAASATDAAWDCGCGSGQASTALAGHFTVVHATDV